MSLRPGHDLTITSLLENFDITNILENFVETIGCILPGGVYILGLVITADNVSQELATSLYTKVRELKNIFNSGEVNYPEFMIYNCSTKGNSVDILNLDSGSISKDTKIIIKQLDDLLIPLTLRVNCMLYTPSRDLETYSQIDNNRETHIVT